MELVFSVVEFRRSGSQHEIRLSQCVDNVAGAERVRSQLDRVDVDHHLLELAAERVRNLDTLQATHAVSHRVIPDRVKLNFAQPLAADRCQNDRHVGGLAAQRERPFNARRQMKHVAGFQIDDVVHRRAGIGSRLEEDLDHCCAGNGSRFLMLDPSGQSQCTFHS